MIGIFVAAATTLAGFNYYPGFEENGATVEAIIDKGLIAELVINCRPGTGIIAVSKIERTFCTPKFHCVPSLEQAIRETCR
jgi:hypothetical protein